MLWIGIHIGIFLGANLGIFIISLCFSAQKGDKLKNFLWLTGYPR
jgi:hypothetical protein